MKKCVLILIVLAIIMTFCGCDMWTDGTYYSVTPHREDGAEANPETEEVSGYTQLQEAIGEMVNAGRESGILYVSGTDAERLDIFMDMAINHTKTRDPIGAYAVEAITYEVGNNAGRIAVAVKIEYNRSRSEILRIKRTQSAEQAHQEIYTALQKCEAGVAVLMEDYTATDFVQLVQDYADENPDVCMETPQVTASIYPDIGTKRVVELTFTYQTSRETLRIMQNYVQPVFSAASLNVSGEEAESTKYARMYAFLMERNDYRVETSLTPSYSLLRHGVGDSKAFAVVYSAMCRRAGLDCQTVSGTRDGNPWVWNIICEDGVYYYVDLLRSEAAGTMLRLTDANMSGYVWDYSAYPETGTGSRETKEPEKEKEPEQPAETEVATEPSEPTVPAETTESEPTEETVP